MSRLFAMHKEIILVINEDAKIDDERQQGERR